MNKKLYSIYQIINKNNAKKYIGYTSNSIEDRFNQHITEMNRGSDTKWHRALRKYQPESFLIECIYQSYIKDDITEKEKHFIKEFDTIKTGYNTHEGGHGGNTGAYHKVGRSGPDNTQFGRIRSDEEKQHQREKILAWFETVEGQEARKRTSQRMKENNINKNPKPESIVKLKQTLRKRAEEIQIILSKYILTSPDKNEYTFYGKDELIKWCEINNHSIWTVERRLLANIQPKSGSLVGWTAIVEKVSIKNHRN